MARYIRHTEGGRRELLLSRIYNMSANGFVVYCFVAIRTHYMVCEWQLMVDWEKTLSLSIYISLLHTHHTLSRCCTEFMYTTHCMFVQIEQTIVVAELINHVCGLCVQIRKRIALGLRIHRLTPHIMKSNPFAVVRKSFLMHSWLTSTTCRSDMHYFHYATRIIAN